MPILRDYWCSACNKPTEQFDDDEEKDICPHCGTIGLELMLSAPNIRTSCKSSSGTVFEPASGLAIKVKENGELGERTRFNCGEVIDITGGDRVIITPQKNPDPEKLKVIAAMMTDKRPPKSEMH
jgi:hypothetical protein